MRIAGRGERGSGGVGIGSRGYEGKKNKIYDRVLSFLHCSPLPPPLFPLSPTFLPSSFSSLVPSSFLPLLVSYGLYSFCIYSFPFLLFSFFPLSTLCSPFPCLLHLLSVPFIPSLFYLSSYIFIFLCSAHSTFCPLLTNSLFSSPYFPPLYYLIYDLSP